MSFVHLHLHTQYSLLDGACRIDGLIDAVKNEGQTAVAVTDHGNMFGAIEFYTAAKEKGIKPIIGCEVYVASRTRHDKVHALDSERYHLILLCKNETGYKNLIKMLSEAWTSGFYVKPRVDRELIEKYHEGLIALSACLAGEIPRSLLNNDYEGAKKTALWYDSVFGRGNYYLELQNHGLREELEIMPKIAALATETGIPLAATNDVHYIKKDDARTQKVLICIQTNHTIDEDTGMDFATDDFYLKSENEMRELFSQYPEAIDNTAKIAEMCNLEFEFGKTQLPNFRVPDGADHFEYFKGLCYEGLKKRYGEAPNKKYTERLEYELSVIKEMGYVDYFLIVSDFINYAKSKDIPVGPGRGSGAGSIAAYCMGITGIDPIKYGLIFERFLNPERVTMPDIDVDFCYERRQEVIDYVVRKYGEDHVAQIVTFGTMAARAAIKDVGRVLGISYSTVDAVSKQIPRELKITIDKALKKNAELRKMYESDETVKELIDTARSVEGMPRHASTHAAGVVITDKPVDEYVPLAKNNDSVVTQYTMTALERLGLLKMDFLGLRTLTVIDHAVKMIRKRKPDFDIEKIPEDDKSTFSLYCSGNTWGVFQCESAGLRRVLMRLKPKSLEDIIAVISLYRPGPMDSIDTFIDNSRHPDKIRYKTPMLKPILDVTNGCMVYQEQIMQIFRSLGGFSFGKADVVRRAMSKKKHDVMERERDNFIEGCEKNGISRETANSLFEDMTSFCDYAFNKSHSTAYALVSYRTAYLKSHYPAEFMAALLSYGIINGDDFGLYIDECRRLGIEIISPDVNRSKAEFTVVDGKIVFGLLAVKNLGVGFIDYIYKERCRSGKYTSFNDFLKRTQSREFNRRAVESLIKCGALDGLGLNRREMMLNLGVLLSDIEQNRRRNVDGQIGLFDLGNKTEDVSSALRHSEEFPESELLGYEKDLLGVYLSGHPMTQYSELAKREGCARVVDLNAAARDETSLLKDNSTVKLLVIFNDIKKKITKRNDTMAFITAEDTTASIELIVFPKTYERSLSLMLPGTVAEVRGRLSLNENEAAKVVVEEINPCPQAKKKKRGLFLRFESQNSPATYKCNEFLSAHKGDMPVYFYFKDTGKYRQMDYTADVNNLLYSNLVGVIGKENVVVQY